jgi:integrase
VNYGELPWMPARERRFREFMKKVLIRANPTTLPPHSMRHTYCSLAAEAGVELAAIQRQLGHRKNNDITQRIYLHITKSKKREAVEKLDTLMNGLI